MATLEALSALVGDEEVTTRSVGRSVGVDGRLQRSVNVSGLFRRWLPVDALARGRPGQALTLDARNRPGWVTLTPAHRDGPWREMVEGRASRTLAPQDRALGVGRTERQR